MDVGLSTNNTRRYIDISMLGTTLGSLLCSALPALHAFTGCDYTATFQRKGKIRPYQIMQKSSTFTDAFASLGSVPEVPQDVLDTIELYVCQLYGQPKSIDVNNARLVSFKQTTSPNKTERPLEKIKRSEPSMLPPCKSVLLQKVKRTNINAWMWKHADTAVILPCTPLDNGWTMKDGHYAIKWFDGEQIPHNVF